MSEPLPGMVAQVTERFLAVSDDAAPGLVEGLYLHGSLGFGEWYHGRSDIDYVAVLSSRPEHAALVALKDVHAALAEEFPRPPFDGFHITGDDLSRSPQECPDVPCTQAGYFHEEARLDVHPVTWHELSRHGVTVRGRGLSDLDIWTDDRALRQYTHDNLAEYWQREVEMLRRFPDEAARPDIVAWFVLGVSRLHHLLATGALTSKSGAGRYALEAFDARWRPIITEALVVRETGSATSEYDDQQGRRGRDNTDFSRMVVESGLAIPL